jgi:hypothetical protein
MWWVLWIGGVVAVAQIVLRIADRGVRRLLPLPALLKCSLVFPDEAPQRFKTALRSGNVERMRRTVEKTAADGLPTHVGDALRTALEMVAELNRHDRGTRGHSERVRAFTDLLATEIGLEKEYRDRLRWGALLHDMGKLSVPAEILNKAGRPTAEEWAILQGHPGEGARILAPLAEWLGDAVHAAGQHHERWDGGGYPKGLSGEEIALSARIVAVADAFAVMTAARAYKKPLSLAVAREELTKGAGTQFDPAVVRAMLTVSVGHTTRLGGIAASLANVPVIGSILSATAPSVMPALPGVVHSGTAALALTVGLVSPTGADWIREQQVDPPVAEVSADVLADAVPESPESLAFTEGDSDTGVGSTTVGLVQPPPRNAQPTSATTVFTNSSVNQPTSFSTASGPVLTAAPTTRATQADPDVTIATTLGTTLGTTGGNTGGNTGGSTGGGTTGTQPPTTRPPTTRPPKEDPGIQPTSSAAPTTVEITVPPSNTTTVYVVQDPKGGRVPPFATTSSTSTTSPPATTAPATTSPPAETTPPPTTSPTNDTSPPIISTMVATTTNPKASKT